MADEIAYALFPTDAPAKAPDWYIARQAEAELRLSGNHNRQDDKAAQQAATIFPTDVPNAQSKEDDGKLFKTEDDNPFDDSVVTSFTAGFAQGALADGDLERAQALEAAGDALVADFRAAGSDAAEVADALSIVRERQADTFAGPVSDEKLQADYASTMAILSEQGVTDSDLNAARAFIRDLEIKAPETIDSLIATGAGNDPRLVRRAVAEAKRRGYR